LNGERGDERTRRLCERREELVGPRLDDVAARSASRPSQQRPHAPQQLAISVAETVQQARRALDVGQ
jgi:hypothetical protein